jgi:hypothetical protein
MNNLGLVQGRTNFFKELLFENGEKQKSHFLFLRIPSLICALWASALRALFNIVPYDVVVSEQVMDLDTPLRGATCFRA